MKLKELLDTIPNTYKIGLVDYDREIMTITYAFPKEAIVAFARKSKYTTADIKNMDVLAVHPCARVYCPDERVFGDDDMPSMHVDVQMLIEVAKGE